MTTTTLTLTNNEMLAAGTSVSAGGAQRAARDMSGKLGGALSVYILNGATGPTVQCTCTVYVEHQATLPATGASTWRKLTSFAGGVTANAKTERTIDVPPCLGVQVEFTGNTGQAVTCCAEITDYTNASTA